MGFMTKIHNQREVCCDFGYEHCCETINAMLVTAIKGSFGFFLNLFHMSKYEWWVSSIKLNDFFSFLFLWYGQNYIWWKKKLVEWILRNLIQRFCYLLLVKREKDCVHPKKKKKKNQTLQQQNLKISALDR